jgi:hypothetical protein
MLDNLRWMGRVLGGIVSRQPGQRRGRTLLLLLVGAGSLLSLNGYVPAVSAARAPKITAAEALLVRAERAEAAFGAVDGLYDEEIEPITRVLRTYRDDPVLTRRIAVALVREAKRVELPPKLLMAVLLVENPWLELGASSSVGAQGLMQVMPLWRGKWKACGGNLTDIDGNICHGARIFAWYLRTNNGNVERALLRYNGCVKGTNTPNCHQYANHVFARAGRASLLGWRAPGSAAAP